MCKLSKEEFFRSKRCGEKIVELFRENDDTAIVLDETLDVFSADIIKAVIAATILSNNDTSKIFSATAKMWASQYLDKIGFLKNSIALKYYSSDKVEELLTKLIQR